VSPVLVIAVHGLSRSNTIIIRCRCEAAVRAGRMGFPHRYPATFTRAARHIAFACQPPRTLHAPRAAPHPQPSTPTSPIAFITWKLLRRRALHAVPQSRPQISRLSGQRSHASLSLYIRQGAPKSWLGRQQLLLRSFSSISARASNVDAFNLYYHG